MLIPHVNRGGQPVPGIPRTQSWNTSASLMAKCLRRRQDHPGTHPVHAAAPDVGIATFGGLDVVADAAELRQRIGLTGQFAAVDTLLAGRETWR
jgi:hypothetical protein